MDPEAPDLDDYLGEVGRLCLNELAVRGDMTVVGGVQKYTIPCNWKFAADNVWDYYHASITHSSALMANHMPTLRRPVSGPGSFQPEHLFIPGEYGHVLSGPVMTPERQKQMSSLMVQTDWRERPEAKESLGELGMRASGHPHVFPNMWITFPGFAQVSLRLPKGPGKTEIWWFTFVDKNTAKEDQMKGVHHAVSHFGPAGMFEQEDGENWGESTHGTRGTVIKHYPLNYAMNIGRGNLAGSENEPPHVDATLNEHGQLWHYRSWAEWMAAESWADLRANHSKPEGTV
jgi:phenylpropionate dioxygenase-like ring-hydroxylating dioxygenase large terminal subunit